MTVSEVQTRQTSSPRPRFRPEFYVVTGVVTVLVLRFGFASWFDRGGIRNWSTLFVAVCLQAMPFLVLGVVVSALVAAFVPPSFVANAFPRSTVLAVPTAAIAGAALPGCECGSVPIAGRLVNRGAPPAAALTFLLSAPAINPVVVVATATAFPGRPEFVGARVIASLIAAMAVGYIWSWLGNDSFLAKARQHRHEYPSKRDAFTDTAQHDFLHAGGFMVVGAATAATMQTVVPRSTLEAVGGSGVAAVLILALLAVILAVCSEADAFVATGLSQFSMTARLAFLVVGPMVDIKLIALQSGTFGRSFALRFAPLTFVCTVVSALIVGGIML